MSWSLCKHIFLLALFHQSFAWFNDPGKVRLEDVKAITLHEGQWTTGRRNPAVPQLKCVGGAAASSSSMPKVVQCRNVGSDGFDVQWECKAEMEDSYRFGKIQVSCEGYDYPNDPYILKGSCGLEYTLEYTGNNHRQSSSNYHHYHSYEKRSGRGFWWKFLLFVALVYFILCKTNLKNVIRERVSRYFQPDRPDFRDRPPDPSAPPSQQQFKANNDYCQNQNESPPSYDDATSTADESNTSRRNEEPSRSRFWNGFGWGGLFGYLFGQRSWWPYCEYSRGYRAGYQNGWSSGWGSRSWGSGSSWGSRSSCWSRGSSNTNSRSTSGFGGTTRR